MNIQSILSLAVVLLGLSLPTFGQIQPGKAVRISILGVPAEERSKIDGEYPVGDNGTVNMPFIGPVRAAGLKPEALAATLEARFRSAQLYRNPTFQVVANVEGAGVDAQVVFLGGQIRRPGPVPYNRTLTLYQAIQAAGGPTEFGSMKRVKLLRGGKQRQYDLTQLQFMQIPLEPNDTIEVPQKNPWGG